MQHASTAMPSPLRACQLCGPGSLACHARGRFILELHVPLGFEPVLQVTVTASAILGGYLSTTLNVVQLRSLHHGTMQGLGLSACYFC
jgi:hypothetical protein